MFDIARSTERAPYVFAEAPQGIYTAFRMPHEQSPVLVHDVDAYVRTRPEFHFSSDGARYDDLVFLRQFGDFHMLYIL